MGCTSNNGGVSWDDAPRCMIRDRDCIYGTIVTRRLCAMGIRDKPIAPASPWQNGFAERLIGSIRRECLDHIVVFGEAHLRRILRSYARYYNDIRTHRSLDKDAPVSRPVQRTGSIKSFPSSADSITTMVRQESLMLPAGEIPAPERGTSRPTGNRALVSWRQRHELSVGTGDELAVTQVKRLSLVMIINRRPTES